MINTTHNKGEKMKKSILSFVSIMALSGLVLSGCNNGSSGSGSDGEPGTCLPDFTAMTVVGYPYEVQGALDNGLNGGPIPALAFNLDGSIAYVSTSNYYETQKFISIDIETGDATIVGDTGELLSDLATQPGTGNVLAVMNGSLYDVNVTDGSVVYLGAIPYQGGPGAITFDTNGSLYSATGTNLHEIDPTDGSNIETITTSSSSIDYIGMGYNAHDGKIYAASGDVLGDIYTIDLVDGNETFVGSVSCPNGSNSCALHDIAFHPVTGEMYGVMGGNGDADPENVNNLVGALVKWGCQ